jgi:chromosome segregation ATPase
MILACLLGAGAALPVQAAAPREGGDAALRQAQFLLQKVSGEKAALEQENLRLAGELKQLKEELEGTSKLLNKTEKIRAQAQQRNSALAERVRSDSERIGDLQTQYRTDIANARADIQLLHSAVEERNVWIEDCRAKNAAMYQTNQELLQVYRDKDAMDALAQREPLTGIGSIEVENVMQDYQFKLEDLRTVKFESGLPESAVAKP